MARSLALPPAVLFAAAGLLVGLRRAEHPYADGDVLWATRAGLDFLRTGTVPRADPYSWTAHGRYWVPNGWGWNVVLGAVYRAAGQTGLAVLGAFAVAGICLLAGVAARRAGATSAWTTVVFCIVAGFFATFLYPRAQLSDYLAMFALPLLLPTALYRRGRPALAAATGVVAIQVAWMNLHTAAVLGPAIVACASAGHLLAPRRAADTTRRAIAVRAALVTVLTASACLASPYGTAPITHIQAVRQASVGLIGEWQPAGFGNTDQWLGTGAILLAVCAGWLALRARRMDTVVLLILFTVATADAIRFAPLAALFAVPEFAAAAVRLPIRRRYVKGLCGITLAVMAVACAVGADEFADAGIEYTSPGLVAALPSDCRLLNDLDIGGALILHRPDVPVSIDSRNDLYGRRAELQHLAVLGRPSVGLPYVRSHGVTCALLPSATPLVSVLEHTAGWRVLGTDSVRTLLVRPVSR